jgi:hypothetical protein
LVQLLSSIGGELLLRPHTTRKTPSRRGRGEETKKTRLLHTAGGAIDRDGSLLLADPVAEVGIAAKDGESNPMAWTTGSLPISKPKEGGFLGSWQSGGNGKVVPVDEGPPPMDLTEEHQDVVTSQEDDPMSHTYNSPRRIKPVNQSGWEGDVEDVHRSHHQANETADPELLLGAEEYFLDAELKQIEENKSPVLDLQKQLLLKSLEKRVEPLTPAKKASILRSKVVPPSDERARLEMLFEENDERDNQFVYSSDESLSSKKGVEIVLFSAPTTGAEEDAEMKFDESHAAQVSLRKKPKSKKAKRSKLIITSEV